MATTPHFTRQIAKASKAALPSGYARVLAAMKKLIAESRQRAFSAINGELVFLYWQIGCTIVAQQEEGAWGDAVVKQLSADLRAAFPGMGGLSLPNLWKMRQWVLGYRHMDHWLGKEKLSTLSRELPVTAANPVILSTLSRELRTPRLGSLILSLSWSHHTLISSASDDPRQHYFYLSMAVRERWSVRELERQIESGLFARYVSVKRNPEKCLPRKAERGGLLPFKDHYMLDYLGLQKQHSERQLRKAMLANLREFFLEFGRDFTLVGEEYPITIDGDTFRIDLLLYHRRLQCLVVLELKNGDFKAEYVGKCQFYLAALDEQIRLPHEKPTIGLILCRGTKGVQMRLALTLAARRVGVATYETVLPQENMIVQRLKQLP